MTERKLASVRIIDELLPIKGADRIEVAKIGGWSVVVKKNEFQVGQLVCYLEIDSWVPTDLAPFLTSEGKEPRDYNGVKGERLKTVKLRGQISQGLVIPLPARFANYKEGQDLTEELGIQKWESKAVTSGMGNAQAAGSFPTHLVGKTDAERIQNYTRQFKKLLEDQTVVLVTEKLDGTSFTAATDGHDIFVCSRNLALKDSGNVYWEVAKKNKIPEWLEAQAEQGNRYAIQGEIVGPGIQGNSYGLTEPTLYIFSIWDINNQEYLPFSETVKIADIEDQKVPYNFYTLKYLLGVALKFAVKGKVRKAVDILLQKNLKPKWKTVPLLHQVKIGQQKFNSVDTILKTAEGKSALNPKAEREGLVFWGDGVKFKAISNKWLMKGGE